MNQVITPYAITPLIIIIVIVMAKQSYSQSKYTLKFSIKNVIDLTPIDNANVKVLNLNEGTSSSLNGFCEIVIDRVPVHLVITHITFNSKTIIVESYQISDTIIILLEPKLIRLDEVSVFSTKNSILKPLEYSILDFDFLDEQLLILEKRKTTLGYYRLLVLDIDFNIYKILKLPNKLKPVKIYKDCLEQCHLLTNDSAFQIILIDSILSYDYPMQINKFHDIMDDCLFQLDTLFFFRRIFNKGFSYEFYSINTKTGFKNTHIINTDNKRSKSLYESIKFLYMHPPTTYSINVAIDFEKRFMYQPYKHYLVLLSDTIVYFNHQNSSIDIYSKSFINIRSCNIDYDSRQDRYSEILIDRIMDKVYTIGNNNLLEINIYTGETTYVAELGFAKKTIIHKGYAYILKKDFKSNRVKTFIDIINLN